MKRLVPILALSIAVLGCAPTTRPAPASEIEADVAYLASWALEGRATGTPGNDSAAVFLVRRYEALGLHGVFRDQCDGPPPCIAALVQPFHGTGADGHNVGAIVPGTEPSRRGEYIVVGAHFDHLGRSPFFAEDREMGFTVRPGADDNASGTAAVLALARRLAVHPARRTIVLVNFDAEETGLFGSRAFVEHLPVEKDSIAFMINLDMVGRLRGRQLLVDGSVASDWLRTVVDSAAHAAGVHTGFTPGFASRSDHGSFARAGIPAISLFTGYHSDYHRVSDIASRVDGPGIAKIVDVVEQAVRIADGADLHTARGPR
jgi:aminopeptidase YwaD